MSWHLSDDQKKLKHNEILEIMFKKLPPRVGLDMEAKQKFRKTTISKGSRILPKDVHYRVPIDKTKLIPQSDYITELKDFLKFQGKKHKRKKLSKNRRKFSVHNAHSRMVLDDLAISQPKHLKKKTEKLLYTINGACKTFEEQENRLKILSNKLAQDHAFVPQLKGDVLDKQFEHYYEIAEKFMSGEETEVDRKMNKIADTADAIHAELDLQLDSIKDDLNSDELEELNRMRTEDDLEDENLDAFFAQMKSMMSSHIHDSANFASGSDENDSDNIEFLDSANDVDTITGINNPKAISEHITKLDSSNSIDLDDVILGDLQ